ncbi:MAG: hypothetical protein ABJH98_09430 [Reichenbachiella sp.]|uniref:hypothetical protein n=1 Tax=Reichenbachiella sp. TaxID=2184521 RepID=UPI003298E7CA
MKFNILFSILTLSFLIFSCGDDDDNDDPFAGVPSSEIVDVDLRDVTLSGSTSTSGGKTLGVGQKWWKQKVSKIELSGECGDNEDQEITDGYYYGFYSSGEYYAKSGQDGTATRVGSWQWVDSDTKDAIFIQSVEFTLRGLNSDELIIASDQSQASCTAITWEQFDQPYTE